MLSLRRYPEPGRTSHLLRHKAPETVRALWIKSPSLPRVSSVRKTGVHGGNKELDAELKQEAQELFEEKYSHELFMKVFQKNYITEKKQPIAPGFIWLPEEE